MKDIDFLPIRYRERTAQRRSRIWRAIMLSCLGAFVIAVAAAQMALKRPIEQQLKTVNAQYPNAVVASTLVEQLQKDLTEVNEIAAVTTYLRHPWPITQLLASVTNSLPSSVVIQEITVDRQLEGRTPPPANDQPANLDTGLAAAAKRDLERLRATLDQGTPVVHVTGVTSDVAALHRFVRDLAPSPLFASAEVESLAAVTSEAKIAGSRFDLRLLTRPGFGQPGGPQGPFLQQTTLASRAATSEVLP
jgi:Tfp pilus assembly protein PilN